MPNREENGAAFNEQFAKQLQEGPPGDIEKVVEGFLLLEIAEVADVVAYELGLDEETKNSALKIVTLYSELEIAAAEIVVTKRSFLGKNTSINIEDALDKAALALELSEEAKNRALDLISKYSKIEILVAYTIMDRLANIAKSVNLHKEMS